MHEATIDEIMARIAAEIEHARETARSNGTMTISGSYDSGRAAGLAEALDILASALTSA